MALTGMPSGASSRLSDFTSAFSAVRAASEIAPPDIGRRVRFDVIITTRAASAARRAGIAAR